VNGTLTITITGLSVIIWIGLLLARGNFWRADQRLGPAGELDHWPEVVAVIPARDEAETIGQTVSSLLAQDYPGELKIIVVDDNSTDGTAQAAGISSCLHVISGRPLQDGWTGKLWAVSQGLEAVDEFALTSKYVLLTDADITHAPGNLRHLVFKAEGDGLSLVSLMVKLRCQNFWERFLIPAFVFFFQKLYPFPWVNDPKNGMAAAAGGCMLVRLDTLQRAGGIDSIKDRLIDDCAMGALIKAKGPIWVGLGELTSSSRAYNRLSEIWHMVARTAFVQLDHSVLKLLGTVVAMVLIYLAPPVGLIVGVLTNSPELILLGTMGWGLMSIAYMPTLRYYKRPLLTSLGLPAAGFLYTLMTVSSAVRHWRGVGGSWKGRSYSK